MGRTIYNANRHIYILKETFGLTEIQPLKYTSQISRFCLYFWVTVIQYKSTVSLNPKLCVVIIYQCGKFVSRGGNIGRAILMLSIYLLLNFRNLRRAIYKHWHGAFTFIFCLLLRVSLICAFSIFFSLPNGVRRSTFDAGLFTKFGAFSSLNFPKLI
jgi:hypothetical protein